MLCNGVQLDVVYYHSKLIKSKYTLHVANIFNLVFFKFLSTVTTEK